MRTKLYSICLTFLCLAILAVTSSGCIPVCFVLPNWTKVPAPSLELASDRVYAFRVDKTNGESFYAPGIIVGAFSFFRQTQVEMIVVEEGGKLEPQTSFHWNYLIGFWPFYRKNHSHEMTVCLYRPGHQAIALKDQPRNKAIVWKQAATILDQETALDKVWSCPNKNWNEESQDWTKLTNSYHLTTLARIFLISEYERLAALQKQIMEQEIADPQTGNAQWQRLRNKANWLSQQSEN